MGLCKSRARVLAVPVPESSSNSVERSSDSVLLNSDDSVEERLQRLSKVDLIVFDNSLRETTVGQIRGHTPADKWKILSHVKSCEFKHVIVAALTSQRRCDDRFCEQLRAGGEDFSNFYAFSDIYGSTPQAGKPWDIQVPPGLLKMKNYGIPHPILEIDLACGRTDYSQVDICAYTLSRLEWIRSNLSSEICPSRVVINIRDLCTAIQATPVRVLSYVQYLSGLQDCLRPFCLITEEPTGEILPEEFGLVIGKVRDLWPLQSAGGGHLAVHVHKSFGLAEALVMEALANGADGIWCGICEEGAAVGHACSALTITNLIRYGNENVSEKYNWKMLRQAAIEITRITTGKDPDPKTELYGARATDDVFDFEGMKQHFDFGAFREVAQETRITDVCTENQLRKRLIECYGSDHSWDDTVIANMKNIMIKDMEEQRKEDYTSAIGIGILYTNAGGHLPIGSIPVSNNDDDPLIAEVHKLWKEASVDGEEDSMSFRDFYDVFMSRYFSCFKCEVTELALKKLDCDEDDHLSWLEFKLWLFWALQEFPEHISTMESLVSTVFEQGILPYAKRRPSPDAKRTLTYRPFDYARTLRTLTEFTKTSSKATAHSIRPHNESNNSQGSAHSTRVQLESKGSHTPGRPASLPAGIGVHWENSQQRDKFNSEESTVVAQSEMVVSI